ncbi:hypothetical protein ES332_D09G289800v1 [Gossypium tomentosum]|uniref:Cyclin n=1 Tax=Gossypium tomentosum TaxID=34277 RepID=A0A5D2JMW3_GOSTO|nr:hypothetical protein ES332_D09G289800v1 [Gossypium tomentosum]
MSVFHGLTRPTTSITTYLHRIFNVLVSAKFMDDICYNNAYYAKVGGISTEEMNILEVDFLFGLGFPLNVKPDTFRTYFFLQREMRLQPPPLQVLAEPYQNINNGRPLKIHCCFNEDESTHQQQLAV